MAQRFKFRLATVLRVRRMELQQQQRLVAARRARIRELEQRAMRLQRQIEAQTAAARATLIHADSLPLEQVLWDRHQLARLRRELMETFAAVEQQRAALAEEQKALTEALKRVRTLERYEERRRAAFDAEQRRTERIAEDEANTQRYALAGAAAGPWSEPT